MAMTQLTVLFLLTLATLSSIGLLLEFGDPGTPVLLGMLGAVLYGVGGLSAFSVHAQAYAGTRAMRPLAIVGIGMALLVFGLTLFQLAQTVRSSAGTSSRGLLSD